MESKTSQITVLRDCEWNYNRGMDTELFDLMQDWGYYLVPKCHAASPGYPGVYVAIRPTPTQKHFDPEFVEARLCNGQGSIERRRLGLHLHGQLPSHVCPGRLTLFDRFNKRADFYTFGAQVTAISQDDATIYSFRSCAPILFLEDDDDNFPEQLGAEVEGLLASLHVAWENNDLNFYQRLVGLHSDQLYQASVRTILELYTAHPSLRERFPGFYARLSHEFQWQLGHHAGFAEGPLLYTLVGTPHTA